MADYAGRQLLDALEADSEDAEQVAAAQGLLRDVLPDPTEDWDPRPFIEAQTWVEAKSMDHEYVILRTSSSWREQVRFIRWLRCWGTDEVFAGRKYRCRDVDGHHYWAMGPNDTIANRRRLPSGSVSVQLGLEGVHL
jgi:hypothetical protein